MKYFTNCKSNEEVKAEFIKLVKLLHPDNNGNAEEFKKMMSDYQKAFENVKNIFKNQNDEYYTKKDFDEAPEDFQNIINIIVNFENVKIELVGSWLWLSGNTYPYKEELKKLKFNFSKSKKMWFYNNGEAKRNMRGMSYKEIKNRYEATVIKNEKIEKIA